MTTVSRRTLFGTVAGLALAPSVAAPAEHADRELLRLCQEFHAHGRACAAASGSSDADDRAHEVAHAARWVTADAIQWLHPVTGEGQAAKAGVAIELLLSGFDPGDSAHVDFALDALRETAALLRSAVA